jgi:hypothetical protein
MVALMPLLLLQGEECKMGSSCPNSHNVFESFLHPQKYRTMMCKDRDKCSRSVCFFAHSPDEVRSSSTCLVKADQLSAAAEHRRVGDQLAAAAAAATECVLLPTGTAVGPSALAGCTEQQQQQSRVLRSLHAYVCNDTMAMVTWQLSMCAAVLGILAAD